MRLWNHRLCHSRTSLLFKCMHDIRHCCSHCSLAEYLFRTTDVNEPSCSPLELCGAQPSKTWCWAVVEPVLQQAGSILERLYCQVNRQVATEGGKSEAVGNVINLDLFLFEMKRNIRLRLPQQLGLLWWIRHWGHLLYFGFLNRDEAPAQNLHASFRCLLNYPLTVSLLLFASFIILTLIDSVFSHLFPVSIPSLVSTRAKLATVFIVHGWVKTLVLNMMSNGKHWLIPISYVCDNDVPKCQLHSRNRSRLIQMRPCQHPA